jgi:ankyrin repeat protein
MEELSLDWFRYTNPPLPKILNTSVGLGIIKSLRDLCLLLLSSGMRECGMTTLVQNYSENEFDVNAMDSRNRNRSVLHVAAQEDDLGVLEALLLLQPDLNLLDKENWSPLGLALREDNVEIASAFIDNKCDVNIGGGIFGSPLHMAVLKLEVWLVKKIIQNNGKVNIMDDDGNTPLHILLSIFSKNSFKAGIIGEALLLAGAKPNFKNKDKWTCVHIAARRGQYEGIEWILEQNNLLKKRCMETFDPNLLGGIEKWSALHLAGHSGHYKIVQHLLSAGADLFIRNNDHRTPRQTSKGNLALNKLFRKAETNAALKQIHLLSHVHDDKETPVERISQFEIGGCDILKEEETLDLVIDNELTKKNKCGYSYTFKETLLEVEKIKQRKKELINKIKIDRRSPKLTLDIDLIEKDLRFESPILTLSKHFQNVDKMAEEGLGRSSSAQTHQKKEFVFGNKNINIYYLKDRIFDEKSRLFEKYEALYSILYIYFDQRNNSTILTVFKNILDNLSLVSDRLLKIQIIQLMGQVNHPSLLPHLENIRKDNLNDKVIRKELSEVVEMINSENSRRKQMILKEKKSHIVEKGVVQRKEHKENNERIKIKSTDFGKTMPLSKLNVIQGTQLSKTSKYFDEIRNNEHGILGDTRVRSRTHETEGEFFPPENNGEEIFSIYDWKNIQALDTLAKQYQSLQN